MAEITVTKPDLPPFIRYLQYLKKIWKSRWLTNNGIFVRLLEKKLQEYLKVQNLFCVGNATLGLFISLKVLELEGEVITTPFTFPATTNVIVLSGLKPVFADIDPETFNIRPDDIRKKITDRTCAILATHVYGNPCYVEELQEIADRYRLKLIYDASHAFAVEYKDCSVLRYGDLSVLSFHATKIFNTIEGGAIVVNDEGLIEKVKLMRNHGIRSEEEVILPGINAKMNEFQAIMGLCNLENVDKKILLRKKIYQHYKKSLGCLPDIKFQKIIASKYNYAYMPVLFQDMETRDRVYSELLKNNIKARKYFYPLTARSEYFKKEGDLVKRYNLKNALDVSNRILCIPLYPDLGMDEVSRIIQVIKDVIKRDAGHEKGSLYNRSRWIW